MPCPHVVWIVDSPGTTSRGTSCAAASCPRGMSMTHTCSGVYQVTPAGVGQAGESTGLAPEVLPGAPVILLSGAWPAAAEWLQVT